MRAEAERKAQGLMADLSSTLSLKRHSRVPPSSVGVTDKKFLSGPVLERTTQKASCSTTVAARWRWYPRRSVLVCGTKPRIGTAVCPGGEDQQRTASPARTALINKAWFERSRDHSIGVGFQHRAWHGLQQKWSPTASATQTIARPVEELPPDW